MVEVEEVEGLAVLREGEENIVKEVGGVERKLPRKFRRLSGGMTVNQVNSERC